MRIWEREGYRVEERPLYNDLHEFHVVKDGEMIATITPFDVDEMLRIIEALDAGPSKLT